MAREMKNRIKHFSIENSDAIEENERILEAGRQQRKEKREEEQAKQTDTASTVSATPTITTTSTTSTTASTAQDPVHTDTSADSFATNVKKTANGIVVNVPMEDYMQLTMMKFQTGRTLKDLALQAIHEFVERNK